MTAYDGNGATVLNMDEEERRPQDSSLIVRLGTFVILV